MPRGRLKNIKGNNWYTANYWHEWDCGTDMRALPRLFVFKTTMAPTEPVWFDRP